MPLLYDDKVDEGKNLGSAVDKIRAKFGDGAISKAAFLNCYDLLGEVTKEDDDMLPFQRGNREKT